MWCHWRDNQFPSQLRTLPDDINPPPVDDGDVDSGAIRPSSGIFMMVAMAMTIAALLQL